MTTRMTSTKYTAVYEYDAAEHVWNVRITGHPGCHTYGRSIRQAQRRIREALALWLDTNEDELTIEDRFPTALASVALGVSRARATAERATALAQQQTLDAVKRLTELGLSRRDAAELLGLSHQRVHQLLDIT